MRNRRLSRFLAVLIVANVLAAAGVDRASSAEDARIRPDPNNPRYWQHQGNPVLLLGGSVEDNLFQIPNLREHLDLLVSVGGNYVRNTMSCRDEGNVWPFARRGGTYDLDRWNDEFWRRFEQFLVETARRDVIVQIEVWATFDYYRDNWDANPLNPKNNVNYTAEQSALPARVPSHPVRAENDFFRSVPKEKNLAKVLEYQCRFVDKILSYSLRFDHVLYCMDNETSVTPNWGAYWATFIRQRAARAGKQVEVTEMWDKWDLAHPQHNATFDHPELYSFVDISQNNHQKGQTHYDNAIKQRRRLAETPRPMNNVKIYGADTGRFGTARDGIERFWRCIFSGCASARFHRPDSGLGLSEPAQRMIQSARHVTGAFDVFACEPRSDLLTDRDENGAYCLAVPGQQVAVYFPRPAEVKINVKDLPGPLSLRWYDIDKGRWLPLQRTPGGAAIPLKTPAAGQWAVVIRKAED